MAYREVTDPSGTSWRVWDTIPQRSATVRPHYANGWIGFESASGRRRLAPIPPKWELSTDDEILTLLAKAESIENSPASVFNSTPREATAVAAESGTLLSYVKSVIRDVDRTIRGS